MTGKASAPDLPLQTRQVTRLVERLLLDLGRLGYGEHVDFDYVDEAVVRAIEDAYAPYAQGRLRVEADYGDACGGTAYFEDAPGAPVSVELDLEDRSVVATAAGTRGLPGRQRWQVRLAVDLDQERILEMHMARV